MKRYLLAMVVILALSGRVLGTPTPMPVPTQTVRPIFVGSWAIDTLFFGVIVTETWKVWDPRKQQWKYITIRVPGAK